MATRTKSTSLRRRFIWTASCAVLIAAISTVSIVSYHATRQPIEPKVPELLASVAPNTVAEELKPETLQGVDQPSRQFKVVQAAAIEKSDDDSRTAGSTAQRVEEQNPGITPAGNFRSSRFNYAVSLAGTRWTRWDDLTSVMPQAEWGALLKNYGRFLVMPGQLPNAEASAEAVDRAMLSQFGFQYPNIRSTDLETIQRWGAEGHVFRISRDISGRENVYRIWILRRDRNAYLVAAWIDRTAAMNSLTSDKSNGAGAGKSAAPPVDDEQLDAEVDAQLDAVLSRFKLIENTDGQVGNNQFQPLRRLVRMHPLQVLFDR
jgi:hypothetical protein